MDLRTPKGTHDYGPRECYLLNRLLRAVTEVFETHGAACIDTPTFELRDLLCNKYGEDSKLIFDLADQGGDICSLRYDLTVSFARFLAKHRVQRLKRFQIGKVFRRDQPSVSKGRLREFVQCDLDIAGEYMSMVADAEAICIMAACLDRVGHRYQIRVSSRMVLNALMECSGVGRDSFATVCSSIDKMDRLPWADVAGELRAKGLSDGQVEVLARHVRVSGGSEVLEALKGGELYLCSDGKRGIDDLCLLFRYLGIYGVGDRVVVDLSLARGLDYYTGVIFEAALVDFGDVGSVAGGGRYDNLVSSVLGKQGGWSVPCVGFSLGITRILSVLLREGEERATKTEVFVGSSGALLLEERMGVLSRLWREGIAAETFCTRKYNFSSLVEHARKMQIPFFLLVGERELAENRLRLMYGEGRAQQMHGDLDTIISFIKSCSAGRQAPAGH
ncbi:UNVERIFIED_CONTAM: hypothetical protein PYX00_011261 [Menopon gallinae]|uniref:histidine--tRNA ligase n=1 Tax=Menopon gallinae TaxID=328185 RepID=A0AAW2H718_9NEOP